MFARLPDHPEIRWAERTGYPSWAQEQPEENEIHLYDEEEEDKDED